MKRILCSVLALLMILGTLAGCGNNGASTDSDDGAVSVTESPKPTESEVEQESDPPSNDTSEDTSDSAADADAEQTPAATADPRVEDPDETTADVETEQPTDEATVTESDETNESPLNEEQKNSVAMLFYLSMVSQEIESSKNNRIYLEEVYSSLLNDTNPAAVDKKTQDHLQTMLTIIKDYRQLELKRDRLQYIYEQDKASSIHSAMPNPIAVLSIVQSSNWKKLVTSVLYTAASSYTSYKSANDSLDKQFMLDGWELDDEETENIHKNRTRAFNYMVEICREYQLPGYLTINENFINDFVSNINNTNNYQKLQYLKSHEEVYSAFGPYWLEMAKCHYELNDYQSCLECISEYESIDVSIFRYDYQYAEVLPMAIVAAQSVYADNTSEYVAVIEKFTDVLNSPYQTKWDLKYFAAQSYMDLYTKTKEKEYLEKAYDIAKNNVNSLVKEQDALNQTYLDDVTELVLSDADTKLLSKDEIKAQQKQLDKLNKSLKEKRKTELPKLYEPLVVNCELLFSLADKLKIDSKEKASINGIISDTFIVCPVAEKYSFYTKYNYSADLTEDGLLIPTDMLTADCSVSAVVNTGNKITDFVLKEVERTDSSISSFIAHFESKKLKSTDWKAGDKITITISNGDNFNDIVLVFKVKEVKSGIWDKVKDVFGSDKVIFECIG